MADSIADFGRFALEFSLATKPAASSQQPAEPTTTTSCRRQRVSQVLGESNSCPSCCWRHLPVRLPAARWAGTTAAAAALRRGEWPMLLLACCQCHSRAKPLSPSPLLLVLWLLSFGWFEPRLLILLLLAATAPLPKCALR